MSIVTLCIPQIGEGLIEARLVTRLKAVGDRVHRDEAIYQMETDKAVMDVESPQDGVIVEWLAEQDQMLPIGAAVVVIGSPDLTQSPLEPAVARPAEPRPAEPRPSVNSQIPRAAEPMQKRKA